MKNSVFLFIILFLFLISSVKINSQWQPDVRLTNDPAQSLTSFNNALCVASSGNSVHAIWMDERDGHQEIYYKRSTNGGINWGADTRLTNNPSQSFYPSIIVSGQIVHIVWSDLRNNGVNIYYKRSTDEGMSWGADTRLTNITAPAWTPSVSLSGQVVHVVWEDGRNGNPEIYYKRSTDNGLSWEADTRLTNDTASSLHPSIACWASIVHVIWEDFRDGNWEIYYKRSPDDGTNWSSDLRITNNPDYSVLPAVAISGSNVHVVWNEYRDGNAEIYYKRSTDNGLTWGPDTRLTNNPGSSLSPSISVSSANVHIVWNDDRDGNFEIYYKNSTDGGTSWTTDTRLTNASDVSQLPSISVSGTIVHVLWTDLRDGNAEIYYKRNPTGNPTGITPISSEIPKSFSISQNYPNPFNPSTKIKFAISGSSPLSFGEGLGVGLSVYDVLGREVSTLLSTKILNPALMKLNGPQQTIQAGCIIIN